MWCIVSDDIFFPSSNLSMVPQVSPDLYGDNNTRLFTYWTVSLLLFLECKIWINDIGWFGGSILFVLPCPIWWLHSLKSIGWHILWILFRFSSFYVPLFPGLFGFFSWHWSFFLFFSPFPWMTTERCLSSHRLLQSSLLWFHSSKQWNSNGG